MLGHRSGERLARELLAAHALEARWTPSRTAAYAIAVAVHVATLALIVAGVAAIVIDFPNVLGILIGVTLLGVGLLMRPRLDRLGPHQGHRVEAPALRALAADVASALDRRPPDEIRIDADWNASWRVVGLRRRRVLTLGLPLLVALEPQERVALIAHEIGHDRNGDARRGLVVGSAVLALDRVSDLLRPAAERDSEHLAAAGLGPIGWMSAGMMWLISRPVDGVLWLEARLLLRDMQRAEYLADALAARVAGTPATTRLLEWLPLWSAFDLVVQHAVHEGASDVLNRLRLSLALVPDRERERRRRAARLQEVRLEDTHPPTGMRIELLEARAAEPPRVVLDSAHSRRIDGELEPLVARVGYEVLDAHRGRLYSG